MPDVYHRTLGLSVSVAEALDPKLWRERYAFGLVLGPGAPSRRSEALRQALTCAGKRATVGEDLCAAVNELPDEVIRWHLRAAASEIEVKLTLPLGIVVVKGSPVDDGLVRGVHYDREAPKLPFLESNRQNFYRIDLPHGVVSVERVRAYWFGQLVWTIEPDDGVLLLEHPGVSSLHLVPTVGSTLLVAAPTVTSPVYGPIQFLGGFQTTLPGVWSVDYTIAPTTKTGEVGQIEAVLAHWIYCKAGILLLALAGRGASKGLTSASLSLDGLSKSVGLPPAINAALEDRLKEATDAIDWQALQTYKRGLRVVPYGA